MLAANGERLVPTNLSILLAICSVQPVSCKICPKITPSAITIPIDSSVLPNPEAIVAGMSFNGIKAKRPINIDVANSAINGLTLNLMISTSTNRIAIRKIPRSIGPVIIKNPPFFDLSYI